MSHLCSISYVLVRGGKMSVPVFIGIAAVFFIVGIICIIKGTSSDENDAVPISSPKEIKELKSSFMPPEEQGAPQPQTETSPKGGLPDLLKNADSAMSNESNQQSEIVELIQKNEQLEKNIDVLNEENQNIKDSQIDKVKALEEKIANTLKEKEQWLPNRQIIDDLKAKGDLFEKQHADNKIQQEELRAFIRTLESEKTELLKSQKSGVDQSEFEAIGNRLEGSITAIETLKGENKDLQQSNQNLINDFKKTQEHNTHLVEREKVMEYELTKNRAQTVGLEKICEGFKTQIENLTAPASDQ